MSRIEQALQSLNMTLPEAPKPVAAYVPVRLTGSWAFISGQIPLQEGHLMASGPVPSATSPEMAASAARQCVLNGLAALRTALGGDLDRVVSVVRVGVFVASDPDFTGQPAVADGASKLLVDLLGEAGKHARAAVGSVSLPLGASVEVEMVVEVRD
ncbi:MAG: RidA family protein [Phycisphaerales bacterium]|nr:RidA family protein [Phycisphaerales bacterium]